MPSETGSITRTRLIALRVLERVQSVGAFADLLLHSELARSGLAATDRAFTTELVYGTLRWRGRIDFLLGQLVDSGLDKLEPRVANALRLGAYQILFCDRVPHSAAVDQAVRCVRAAGAERATGLVNAVLRRLAREHATLALPDAARDPLGHLTHALSLPGWLAERWIERFGAEQACALARASNEAPPLTLRANRLRTTRDALLAELLPNFPEAHACRFAEDGIVLGRSGNPATQAAFLEGRCTVQDEASQLVVALLDPQPGERVLDVCAAPGGKAGAIAERVGLQGRVLALDRHPRRCELIERQARRLGLENLETRARDAAQDLCDLAQPQAFDRVLVDAPCSGLGTLRRNADARWRVRPGDPERLARNQAELLASAARVVKAGGTLVYSTCTLLSEENETIAAAFETAHPDFRRTPAAQLPAALRELLDAEGALRCLPHRHDTDGFYAVRWTRNA